MMRPTCQIHLAAALALGVLATGGCKKQGGLSFEELQYPVATKTVQVGNATVAYTEAGSGDRTLVLIHGLGSYIPAWSKNLEALSSRYRVVAIDLPGYGKSSKQSFAYSMDFFAQVVEGVVRKLDLKRVTLVGHSMGGQIALTYALKYPTNVESLVLTSPAGLETFEDGEASWLANAVTPEYTCEASPETIYVRHVSQFYKPPKDAEFMVRDREEVVGGPDYDAWCVAIDRSVSGMLDAPVADRLSDIRIPVLVLFGKNDELIPNPFLHGGSTERMAKKAVAKMPRAELVVLPKAGHMAQFEQSEAWNAAVLKFLAEDPGPPPEVDEEPAAIQEGIVPLYSESEAEAEAEAEAESESETVHRSGPADAGTSGPEPEPESEAEPTTAEPS
jgi:pimeloyl-ACP methyl ester carboxylesterase